MRLLDVITDSMDVNLSKLWEIVKNREVWCAVIQGLRESNITERLNNKCMEDASVWVHRNHSFAVHLSYLGPVIRSFLILSLLRVHCLGEWGVGHPVSTLGSLRAHPPQSGSEL